MTTSEKHKHQIHQWFSQLQHRICEELQGLEEECMENNLLSGVFEKKKWDFNQNGGGIMAILQQGRIFEKAGVNVSCVSGKFSQEFANQIPGAEEDANFWACGLSLVIHPLNPHVPIIHMNTRHIVTTQSWFGGGIDLTPSISYLEDTQYFHQTLQECCDRHDTKYYPKFKKWCDEYFYLPHRQEARGVGGIFYDYLDSGNFANDFAFTQDVGEIFLNIYPNIVRSHMNTVWDSHDKYAQLLKRGRYVEFNLLYDRGTQFGLKTGGNTEAILMSLPPLACWA